MQTTSMTASTRTPPRGATASPRCSCTCARALRRRCCGGRCYPREARGALLLPRRDGLRWQVGRRGGGRDCVPAEQQGQPAGCGQIRSPQSPVTLASPVLRAPTPPSPSRSVWVCASCMLRRRAQNSHGRAPRCALRELESLRTEGDRGQAAAGRRAAVFLHGRAPPPAARTQQGEASGSAAPPAPPTVRGGATRGRS